MKIKNWAKFQHFKDRKPPWIKLYRDLLDDLEWHELDPSATKILIMLWLIASESDGILPPLKEISFRLRMSENLINAAISKLYHWLEHDDINTISGRYQDDRLETETETQGYQEVEKRKNTGKILLPDSWKPSESHYDLGSKKGLSKEAIEDAVGEMRAWSLGNSERRANWDWVFNNWLRRRAINGHRGPRPLQDDSKSVSRAAGRLAEAAKRGDFSFGPIPSLLPKTDPDTVLVLPKGRSS